MKVLPTTRWFIEFFTGEETNQVKKYVEPLDKGELTLFLPSVLIIQTLVALKTEKKISYQKSASAFLSLLNTGCAEVEEKELMKNTLHQIMNTQLNASPLEIYLSLKAEKMNIKSM